MTITARYASTCCACHQPIAVGAQIEWAKGQPARHTTCGASAPHAVPSYATPARNLRHARYADRPGTTYERGVGRTCDECGEIARRGTVCWETGARH